MAVFGPSWRGRWASLGNFAQVSVLRLFGLRLLVGFPLYSCISPAKEYFSNTSGNISIVKVYVCKTC